MVQKERKTQLMFSWKHMGCWWGPHSACKLCEQKNKKMETNNIINKVNLLFIQVLSHVLILFNPMDCSMPSFPDRYFPELAQTHVHWVSDVIQPSLSVTPFSSCPQSFPVSGSFPMSQLFASHGQSIRASASAISPSNKFQGWFLWGLTGLISLLSRGLLRVFFSTTIQKHQFFGPLPSLLSNSHTHTWLLEKP